MSFLHQATSSYFIAMNMQQLLSSSNIASSSTSTSTSSLPPCLERLPPEWPSSLKIIQRKIPDDVEKEGESTTITYYDVNLGANLIQIIPDDDTNQPTLWDLELNSGHSYYFYPSLKKCQTIDFPVGILRQNWLQDAQPLGEFVDDSNNGNVSCGWTKIDFIDYYANKDTNEPTSWYFHTMKATFQVLEYEENPTIDPNIFEPPEYCFP